MVLAQLDWGSVPDWLAGAGALLALIFAFLAVRAAHRTNVQQGLELQTLQDVQKQAQAARLAAWPLNDDSGKLYCRVRNASDLPVFGGLLFRGLTEENGDLWWCHERVRTIPPGEITNELHDDFPFVSDGSRAADRNLIAIVFRDCQGRTWVRNSVGELAQHEATVGAPGLYGMNPRVWVKEEDQQLLAQLLR